MRFDGQLALGHGLAHGGHHGVRLVAGLLILAGLIALVVLLVRRARRKRTDAAGRATAPPAPRTPPGPAPSAPGTAPPGPRTPPGPTPSATLEHPPPATGGTAASGPRPAGTISARGLTKRYGRKIAVDGLSFDVQPGRVTGFLGPNGAGKSTTMRLIMGLDAPSAGSVTINGQHYHDLVWPLREVGALLEARAIHPGRSARAHLWALAQSNRVPRRRVEEVLGMVGLSEVADQRAGQFSLGMGQRLGIAAALLGDPGVLLFDEPINGLDTEGIRWVRGLLRGLAADGRTVFVSSHLMTELALSADHVVVVARGQLIADLPIAEFTDRYTRAAVRVRAAEPERLVAALRAAGARLEYPADDALSVSGMDAAAIGDLACRLRVALHELSPQHATLEAAFLESTEGQLEYRGAPAIAVPAGGGERS